MTDELREYVLPRTDKRPISFRGKLVHSVKSPAYRRHVDKPGVKAHWFECNVYETEGKRFVVHLAYRWAGRIYRETNQDYVDDFATLQEISGHLDTFVARDCVVGFPEGDYWAEKQAALLAQVDSDFDALAEEVESGLLALYAAPERVN